MAKFSKLGHPLIYTYLKKYQDDPYSRVFAPLAESYRKAGMVDAAIEIAREGLRIHPHFVSGRVALARALFDKKQYQSVLDELVPVVQDVPDNLIAQRLLAESFLMLGNHAESLNAYKMLLYFLPQDGEVAKIVDELEQQVNVKGSVLVPAAKDFSMEFQGRPVESAEHLELESTRVKRIRKIERLQNVLQKLERYRAKI